MARAQDSRLSEAGAEIVPCKTKTSHKLSLLDAPSAKALLSPVAAGSGVDYHFWQKPLQKVSGTCAS